MATVHPAQYAQFAIDPPASPKDSWSVKVCPLRHGALECQRVDPPSTLTHLCTLAPLISPSQGPWSRQLPLQEQCLRREQRMAPICHQENRLTSPDCLANVRAEVPRHTPGLDRAKRQVCRHTDHGRPDSRTEPSWTPRRSRSTPGPIARRHKAPKQRPLLPSLPLRERSVCAQPRMTCLTDVQSLQ